MEMLWKQEVGRARTWNGKQDGKKADGDMGFEFVMMFWGAGFGLFAGTPKRGQGVKQKQGVEGNREEDQEIERNRKYGGEIGNWKQRNREKWEIEKQRNREMGNREKWEIGNREMGNRLKQEIEKQEIERNIGNGNINRICFIAFLFCQLEL